MIVNPIVESPRARFLQRIRSSLLSFDLPIGSYIIAGSGPLAIRDLREASDIDLIVNNTLWQSLLKQYPQARKKENLIALGTVEIWKDWMILTEKIDEMIVNCDMIDGFPFMKLSEVIETKKHMGRPKDVKDVELIHAFLEQEQQAMGKR